MPNVQNFDIVAGETRTLTMYARDPDNAVQSLSGLSVQWRVGQPAAVTAGTTTILDNATVIYTYTAGTLADLRPIIVPIGAFSVSGAWKITTGANMAALGVGNFT